MEFAKDSENLEGLFNYYTNSLNKEKEEQTIKENEIIKLKMELININDDIDNYLNIKKRNIIFDKKIRKNNIIAYTLFILTLVCQVLAIKYNFLINSVNTLLGLITFPILPILEVIYFSYRNKKLERRKNFPVVGIYNKEDIDAKVRKLEKEKKEKKRELNYVVERKRIIDKRVSYFSSLLLKINELYSDVLFSENLSCDQINENLCTQEENKYDNVLIKSKKLN